MLSWKQSKMFSGNMRKMFFICFVLVLEGPAVKTAPNPHLPKGEKFRPEEAEGMPWKVMDSATARMSHPKEQDMDFQHSHPAAPAPPWKGAAQGIP